MRMDADNLRELIKTMELYVDTDSRLSTEYSVDATPIYITEDETLDVLHDAVRWMNMNGYKIAEDINKTAIASARCAYFASQLDLPNVSVSFEDMLDMMDGRDNKSCSEDKK